jgi:predicted aspartyl protease
MVMIMHRLCSSLIFVIGVVGLQGCASAPTTASACHLTELAALPVTFIEDHPTIIVKIAGHDEVMMIDTGAFASVITEKTAAALGAREIFTTDEIQGIGGLADIAAAHPGDTQIGGIMVKDPQFVVVKTLIPNSRDLVGVDGIIGQDILKFYNLGLDFPHKRFTMYARNQCPNAFPFGGYFSPSPSTWSESQQLLVPISVDQKNFTVMLDTGSDDFLMNRSSLDRAGISGTVIGNNFHVRGLGQSAEQVTPERFDSVTIGAEEVDNAELDVDAQTHDGYDGILGETYFKTHQLYIANDSQTVYFGTYMPPPPAG